MDDLACIALSRLGTTGTSHPRPVDLQEKRVRTRNQKIIKRADLCPYRLVHRAIPATAQTAALLLGEQPGLAP